MRRMQTSGRREIWGDEWKKRLQSVDSKERWNKHNIEFIVLDEIVTDFMFLT